MANPALQTIRRIEDASLQANTVLGVNNATTSTAGVDLGAEKPYPVTQRLTAQITTTAGTNAANNKNVNITIQHSNVNLAANFVNIPELAPLTIPEVSAAYAATTRNVALPPNTAQFVRLRCNTENAGGNPNDGVATLKILV
jgi:hypothetical protein